MTQLLQFLLSGVVIGCVYGIIALGFTLIYNVSGVVNLVQGDFFVAGAFIALGLMQWTGLPLWAAALVAVAAVALLGVILERFVIRLAKDASISILLVLTVGASMIVEGIMLIVYGGDAKGLPPIGKQTTMSFGGVHFIAQDLWLFGFVAVVVVGLFLFLRTTNTGIAMRATQMSVFGASVTGINTSGVRLWAFGISGAIGAGAAIFAAPITFVGYDSGTMFAIKAFVAAVLGGLGKPIGAVLGGIGLGIAEALSSGYISSLYSDVIAFAILLIALIYRSLGKQQLTTKLFVVRATFSKLPQGRWRRWMTLLGIAAALLFPLTLTNDFMISLAALLVVYIIVLLGLDLLSGYTGMISLGHAAFMGIGAYSTALLTTKGGWSPMAALVIGMLITALVSWLFALISVRLEGFTLALATMAFAVIFEGLMRGLVGITGGSSGLGGIGDLSLFGFTFSSLMSQLYLVIVIFLLMYAWMRMAMRRQPGRIMNAIHGDELAARSLGISPSRTKTKVFVLSAVIASAMGSIYAHFQHFATPDQFGLTASLLLLVMLTVGGEGTLWGVIVGVAIIKLLPQYFSALAEYQLLINGALLTAVLLLLPGGAAGGLMRLTNVLWDRIHSRAPHDGATPLAPKSWNHTLDKAEPSAQEVVK